MKNKIISILLALITLLTLLTGCQTDDTENSSETSIEEKSPKDIFLNSLNNQYIKMLFGENYDGYEYINLKGNGEFKASEETANLDYDINLALQDAIGKGDFSLTYLEEVLKGNFLFDGENAFYSLPDVYEETIKSFIEIPETTQETDLTLDYKIYTIMAEYMNAVSHNKFDGCFSSEKCDEIIIRNIQFKDETLYTFEITDEKAKEILGDDYNQDINSFDISIIVKYIEKDGKVIAATAEGFANQTQGDKKEEYSFKLEFSENGIDFDFSLNLNEVEVKTTFLHNYVLNNQNGTVEIVVTVPNVPVDQENSSGELKAIASVNYKNGRGDINFEILSDLGENDSSDEAESIMKIELPFEYGIDQEGRIYFCINQVEVKSTGVTVIMDISAQLYFKPIKNGGEISVEFNYAVGEENLTISADLTFTETEKFEVTPPTDFIPQEEATDLEDTLIENYPNISEFLGLISYDEGEVIWVRNSNGSAQYYFVTDTQSGWITDEYWFYDDEADKEIFGFNFKDLVFDEYGMTTVDINGLTFDVMKSDETIIYSGYYYLEYLDPKNPDIYFSITYEPRSNNLYLDVGFVFTSRDDKVTLTFADGTVIEKTILYDNRDGVYYFED